MPEAIVIPQDHKTLPSVDSYPYFGDIHFALDQAEAEAKWITGIDNVKEQQDKIKYLKLLAENSPEKKMVEAANKKAGADTFYIGFSTEQSLFIRGLFENDSQFNSFDNSFSERSQKEEYDRGSTQRQVLYYKDLFSYIEDILVKREGALPSWFTEKKAEFARLFPQSTPQTGGTEKESKK